MIRSRFVICLAVCFGITLSDWISSRPAAQAEDFFLTIAGGYSPTGNQVSLEKNVMFFQRLLRDQKLAHRPVDIFFADGFSKDRSLQVKDVDSVPLPNRLMAEFFGSQRNLGLHYRPHQVPDIRGATTRENIQDWFRENGPKMSSGDRLILYVSAHGGTSRDDGNPHNTSIYLWNRKTIVVDELVQHLDSLPEGVEVVSVMVQCHAGGFARLIFDNADPDSGLSRHLRCGFFATVHSRPAAGCTPEVNEANYEEYSTYFWAALGGENRLGEAIDPPDYDGDGRVCFDEAHAYSVLTANTIDLPIKTSGEFLRSAAKFGEGGRSRLLPKDAPYSQVLALADPIDRAVLEGLSQQLELSGQSRIANARKQGAQRRSRSSNRGTQGTRTQRQGRGSRPVSEVARLRQQIATDVKRQWPELANVMNPVAVELVTTRADDFVSAIENHKDYQRYRELTRPSGTSRGGDKARVKYERFVRVAENVILAENLSRQGDKNRLQQYERLIASEHSSLQPGPKTGK